RDGTQRLALEVRELRLKLEHALCRVIPALLEGASDQSVVGIHGLVAPFRQISIIACALDPPAPLRRGCFVAFFETGQRRNGELNGQRRDGGNDAIGNGTVERLRSYSHAGGC